MSPYYKLESPELEAPFEGLSKLPCWGGKTKCGHYLLAAAWIKRGTAEGRLFAVWWYATPSSAELIYFVAVAADSFSGIRISVSRLPWLTEHRKLSTAPPGSHGQIGTPEVPAP